MKTLEAAAIGVGVMIACFVPPILHFVTGPLSPAIGGFVAGLRLRAELGQAGRVGALMAALVLGVAALLGVAVAVFDPGLLPGVHWSILVLGVLGAGLYTAWLATLGAWAGGAVARHSDTRARAPEPTESSESAEEVGTTRH